MIEEIKALLEGRAWECGIVDTAALDYSPELYATCATNVCGNYGKTWSCPPAVGSLEEQRKKINMYTKALVFTSKCDLEDSFDFEGMQKGREAHNFLTAEIHERLGAGYPVYGAGGCSVCGQCSYPEPCPFPAKAVSSIEAAGINVTTLSRSAGIHYHNGPNTVTYFSMILFKEGRP
ncbi:MAG: DUF2284 domain-containing protein [Treponema sp.]|jgi:predicted metal-binding protein|nr:DUF2284 domain-containing protein [Treponema sp.]